MSILLLISFHIFHRCTILVYSIGHTGFLLYLGRFQRCNLGEFCWCTQVQTGSKNFLFHVAVCSREIFKLWHGNSCFAFKILWNTLKDGLCYLQNETVSMKVFLLNMHEVRILFNLGKRNVIWFIPHTKFFSTKTTGLA